MRITNATLFTLTELSNQIPLHGGNSEEIDLDMDGEESVPEQGSFIDRKGERRKVV
jgi:hypothetical protein